MTLPKFHAASDVRALKDRVSPMVDLVDALVGGTPALFADLRAGWAAFKKEWTAYVKAPESWFASEQYADGEELVRKFRIQKSLLSSQCDGVPDPASLPEVPFLPTFASLNDVREAKNKIGPQVRELDVRVSRAPQVTNAFRNAWRSFVRGWTVFENEPEEFSHGAAQLDTALAFEATMPEWEDAFRLAKPTPAEDEPGAAEPSDDRSPAPPPPDPSGRQKAPTDRSASREANGAPAGPAAPSSGVGTAVVVGGGLVLCLMLAQKRRRAGV